jgi:uncharacterized membrane protein
VANLPIPLIDAIALVVFLALWSAYAWFAHKRATAPDNAHPSLMSALLYFRRQWMEQMLTRDNRITDTASLNNLLQPCTFFASTTVLIMGGVLSLLPSADVITQAISGLPFQSALAQQQGRLLHEVKVFTLVGVFGYAFFKFTWAMRQYSTSTVLVVSAPTLKEGESAEQHKAHINSAAAIASLAGENFNLGLRGYYFGLAAVTWFLSPWVMMITAAWVTYLVYQREFHSRTLQALLAAMQIAPNEQSK